MSFIDILGLSGAGALGLGIGIRAFNPIIAPLLGKTASLGFKTASFAVRKALIPSTVGVGRRIPPLIRPTLSLGMKSARFVMRHPYLTAGAVGAGVYLATNKSPYDSPSEDATMSSRMRTNLNEEQIAIESLSESGVAPMGGLVSGKAIRNQRLMQSTSGLVQGMWRSRH